MPVGDMLSPLVVAVFAMTLALAGLLGGGALLVAGDKARRRRIERAAGRVPVALQTATASVRRRGDPGGYRALESVLRRIWPGHAALQARLARTGHEMSVTRFLVICALLCALFLATFGLLVGVPWALAGPVALVGGWLGPNLAVGFLGARRTRRFLQDLPEAIDVMVRGLKSGLPVTEMIATVGNDFEGPVGAEFKGIADRLRFGIGLETALWEVAGRLDVAEFNFLAVSVGLQRETGGNLTETLRNLADLLRKRQQLRLKVKALSSEARASAYIVGALPFLMLALIFFINPEYIGRLFEDPRGHWMLAGAAFSELLGAAVMFRMARFEV